MFTYRDRVSNVETRMTVADYFAKVRQQRLQYPHLPCLVVGKKDKQSFLPVEVVMVREKQKYIKKLDDKQTADMIKRTALPAAERKQKTLEMVNEAFGPQAQDEYLKTYETAINTQMVKLTGRVIEPPCLQYKSNQPTTPAGGEWKCERSVFTEGGRIKTCAVLCMHRGDTNVVATFYNALLKKCHEMGMAVNPALANNPTYFGQGVRVNMLEQHFEEAVKCAEGELDLIIIIMDGRSADAYAAIKRLGDIEKGVMTQVLLSKNLQGRDGGPSQMTCTNLALKINLKRAGQNYHLLPPRGDASVGDMFVGFAAD
jgi:eukaryotic translation initiation factor 2C